MVARVGDDQALAQGAFGPGQEAYPGQKTQKPKPPHGLEATPGPETQMKPGPRLQLRFSRGTNLKG
ncbi:hypothetical protein TthAA37_22280 (plasmid) [Thermus thermophilus]|uniref:Uncharacterized protein n=1 Tax=Thermus thermophilus TaxID=274 RepID=A0AAD1KW73_THETH|nr:hypothetical protein TthAA220_21130 [Thermus thermophilus]BBL85602.1 hypothetical protein TthAA229_20830 [Thermus thermophilus]BCZ88053.1 hypothetical protein TthAA11_22350 [Thermus thermophilus]BCZ90331.1 hypothetical protein TthAA22_21360 [Thermus thermophilus]BCZ93039.1 hypothetical protein TthAA37_22280 [Thermus thermophilus]